MSCYGCCFVIVRMKRPGPTSPDRVSSTVEKCGGNQHAKNHACFPKPEACTRLMSLVRGLLDALRRKTGGACRAVRLRFPLRGQRPATTNQLSLAGRRTQQGLIRATPNVAPPRKRAKHDGFCCGPHPARSPVPHRSVQQVAMLEHNIQVTRRLINMWQALAAHYDALDPQPLAQAHPL